VNRFGVVKPKAAFLLTSKCCDGKWVMAGEGNGKAARKWNNCEKVIGTRLHLPLCMLWLTWMPLPLCRYGYALESSKRLTPHAKTANRHFDAQLPSNTPYQPYLLNVDRSLHQQVACQAGAFCGGAAITAFSHSHTKQGWRRQPVAWLVRERCDDSYALARLGEQQILSRYPRKAKSSALV